MTDTISNLKQQLLQLKELHETGALSAAKYEESRAALERSLVDQVLLGGRAEAVVSDQGRPQTADAHAGAAAVAPAESAQRISRGMLATLIAAVVLVAGAGYLWKGAPSQLGAGSAETAGAADGAGQAGGAAPHATSAEQIAAMTDKLAERMKTNPQDVEGWAMLARSYTVLNRHPEAQKAYEKAIALRSDDPVLLVDYADSMAVNNNMTLSGEPMKWVEKALKLDPRNLKGLSLAGTAAFLAKDYAGAVKYWDQVVAFGPPDSAFVQQAQGGLEQARELGKLPAAAKPMVLAAAAPGAAPSAAPAAMAGKTVSGTVSLAPALAKQAGPDDTVFVFARAAEGRGMPLAILRKKVSDLPITFTLDDSSSMSPAATLSAAGTVIVGARISKSGNAMPQDGDISGQTGPVSVGASGLKIEIRDVVKR